MTTKYRNYGCTLPFLILLSALLLIFGICKGYSQTTNITNLIPAVTPAEAGLLQQVYDSTIGTSNGIFVATAARKLTGNVNRYSIDYLYSFNANAGLVLGIDDVRSSGYSQANVIKGGINLQANIYPFKNFGATNFFVTPFASVLIATPVSGTSNNGGVGEIAVTGVSYEHSITKNFSLEVGGLYENCTGQGQFDGNYIGGVLGVHYKF